MWGKEVLAPLYSYRLKSEPYYTSERNLRKAARIIYRHIMNK